MTYTYSDEVLEQKIEEAAEKWAASCSTCADEADRAFKSCRSYSKDWGVAYNNARLESDKLWYEFWELLQERNKRSLLSNIRRNQEKGMQDD